MQIEALKNTSTRNNWYAIYVSSRTEKKTVQVLLSKGIEAYTPLVKTLRQWSDRKKMIELPLLSGYVFIKLDLQHKNIVLQTKNVVGFVKHCGEIAKIREKEIDQLKLLVNLGYHIETIAINKAYHIGDKVKIASGALKNVEGFVTDTKTGKFVEVLLDSIGQVIKVKLPENILMSI